MKHQLKSLVALAALAVSSLGFAQPQAQVYKSSPSAVPAPVVAPASPQVAPSKPAMKQVHKHHYSKAHKKHHGKYKKHHAKGDRGLYKLNRAIAAGKKDGSLTSSELSLISSKMQSLKKNIKQAHENKTYYRSEVMFLHTQYRDVSRTVYELRHNKVGKQLAHKPNHYSGKDKMHGQPRN